MDRSRGPQRAADQTRSLLVDAATRVFADQGVLTASLLEVTRLAGQRNRGAVHYHFGSRDGILIAVLERHADRLARRQAELLEQACSAPDDDLAAAVAAVVRPVVELGESDWRGACYLRIVRDLVAQDPATIDPEVWSALEHTGGRPVFAVIQKRMPVLPQALADERLLLFSVFLLQSVADRAATAERPGLRRPRLDAADFADNLIAMATAMLSLPATTA